MPIQTRPVQSIRIGAITAAIWLNEVNVNGRPVRLLKTTVERRYRDSNGSWKSSNSFSSSDLPTVIATLVKALNVMIESCGSGGDELVVDEETIR